MPARPDARTLSAGAGAVTFCKRWREAVLRSAIATSVPLGKAAIETISPADSSSRAGPSGGARYTECPEANTHAPPSSLTAAMRGGSGHVETSQSLASSGAAGRPVRSSKRWAEEENRIADWAPGLKATQSAGDTAPLRASQ